MRRSSQPMSFNRRLMTPDAQLEGSIAPDFARRGRYAFPRPSSAAMA
jgi:hypothetical protein